MPEQLIRRPRIRRQDDARDLEIQDVAQANAESASAVFAAAARDEARAALLRAFLASGLIYMLGAGTLLGVVNLLQISGRESVALTSSAWIQAHDHAQVFGWIGSFHAGHRPLLGALGQFPEARPQARIWGVSRHAFTVGFVTAMVLAAGQRMLPGFAAHRPLWSPRLMGVSLSWLMAGCLLREPSEILAYEQSAAWPWSVPPVSGLIELAALGAFAVNVCWTMWRQA